MRHRYSLRRGATISGMKRDRMRIWRLLRLTPLALLALCAGSAGSDLDRARAQDPFAPAIRVNDEIITGYDLSQRARLIRFARGRDVPNVGRLAARELIEDSLKFQEAERLGVTLTDAEFETALQRVVASNRLNTADELFDRLREAGVDRETFERRLRAEAVWNRTLARRFGARMRPEDGEVEAAMEASKRSGPLVYDLRQVALRVSANAPVAVVRRAFDTLNGIKTTLSGCDQLDEVAKQYPPLSGKVGDLTENQLPREVREVIEPLEIGQAADPIRSQEGVHVFMVCGKGQGGGSGGSREQMFQRLLNEKAARLSESYLADLERNALILSNNQ